METKKAKQGQLKIIKARSRPTERVQITLPSEMVRRCAQGMEKYGLPDLRTSIMHYLARGLEAEAHMDKMMGRMGDVFAKGMQEAAESED